MKQGNVYRYMYDENSVKLEFLGILNKQYRFINLSENVIEVLPKEALQGLIEVNN